MEPFDPARDLETLRVRLRRLASDHRLSAKKIIYEARNLAKNELRPKLEISIATLNKFKSGENTARIYELSVIWDYINSKYPMDDSDGVSKSPDFPVIKRSLYASLTEKFSEKFDLFPSFTLESLAPYLTGSYTMYRRDASCQPNGETIFVSGLMIWFEGTDALIAEVRAVPQSDGTSVLYVLHEGTVFTRGTFIHFVMKEAAGVGMMFGTIDRLWPLTTDSHIWYMTGSVYIVKAEGVMPSCRFYCELLADGEYVKSGVFDATQIDNKNFIANI